MMMGQWEKRTNHAELAKKLEGVSDEVHNLLNQHRGAGETTISHQVTGTRDLPNYHLFLKGSANNAALAAFVNEYIASKALVHLQCKK